MTEPLSSEQIALAAFLHDIGKFWWPATGKRRPESVNAWLDFLPSSKDGRPTHLHAAYSAAFVSRYVCGPEDETFARLVAGHHDPSSREEWIIAVADRIASGERQKAEEEIKTVEAGTARIANPFSRPDEPLYFPYLLNSHCAQINSKFFPDENDQLHPDTLKNAWRDFIIDIEQIGFPIIHPGIWMALLKEYTSRLPAQSPTPIGSYQPDISLYDHGRVSAALAYVLADSDLEIRALENLPQKDSPIFSLIAGDISGVQDFIYSGPSERAVRFLKGRSFFLQFLTRRLSAMVQDELGLSCFSELFAEGGQFMLIGPANPSLSSIRAKIEQALSDSFHGQLGLSLAAVNFNPVDLVAHRMGDRFTEAKLKLGREKQHRMHTLAKIDYNTVFAPRAVSRECITCRSPLETADFVETSCQVCRYLEALGTDLRKARFLVEYPPETEHPLAILGQVPKPVKDAENLSIVSGDRIHIWQLNRFDTKEMGNILANFPSATTLTFGALLAAVHVPMDESDNSVLDFGSLAKQSHGDQNHLAMVRADVDNLGLLFKKVETLSQLATLSRSIVDFFNGHTSALFRHDSFKDRIYPVYSGGDDLFIVGAWDAAIEAGQRIRDDFHQYTSKSQTLSAGIALVHPKFPLKSGAELAGNAEHGAKQFDPNNKDGVSLFNQALPWRDFYQVSRGVEALRNKIENGAPRQLVNRIMEVAAIYEKGKMELKRQYTGLDLSEAARWYRWRWILAYSVLQDLDEKDNALRDVLLNQQMEPYLGLMARWAQFATRR